MENKDGLAPRSIASLVANALLSILIAFQSGCASVPLVSQTPPPSTLGKVAVVTLERKPEISFKGFARSKGEGAATGAGSTFSSCVGGMGSGSCDGAFCGAAYVIWLGICGIASGVGGAIGAAKAPSAEEARTAEANLTAAMDPSIIQLSLRDQVVATALAEGTALVSLPSQTVETAIRLRDYRAFAAAGVDTVLETVLTKVGTKGSGINKPLLLYMQAHVRLVSTRDNAEVFSADYEYEGEKLKLSAWSANRAERLLQGLQRGYQTLGAHVHDQVLMLYPFPDREAHETGMLAVAFGLRPIDPPTRASLTGDPFIGSIFEWKTVDTLQPTLRWERFPRATDIAAAPDDMGRIRNVRYDLIVSRENNLVPGEIVYRRDGLSNTAHTLETPLTLGSRYFWTVRARFELDGRTRVTEWGAMNYAVFGKLTAPSQWSYRFKTKAAPPTEQDIPIL